MREVICLWTSITSAFSKRTSVLPLCRPIAIPSAYALSYRPNCCAAVHTRFRHCSIHAAKKNGNLCKRAQHNSTSLKQEPATLGHSHVLHMQRDDDTQRMGDGELKFNWKRKVCPTCPKKWNQVWWVWCFFWNSGFSKTCRWCLPVMFRKKGPTKMHFDWTFFQNILGWKSISLPLCRTAISHASAPGIQNQLMRENDCRREMASKIWRL